MSCKKYVDVTARFDEKGNVKPLFINWEDGRKFSIDKVLDARPGASLKAGGAGMRYKCRIHGHVRLLFLEEMKWFIESKM